MSDQNLLFIDSDVASSQTLAPNTEAILIDSQQDGVFSVEAPAAFAGVLSNSEPIRGISVEYFQGNNTTEGNGAERTEIRQWKGRRIQDDFSQDWGNQAPEVQEVGTDEFVTRWTGYIYAPETGNYQFYEKSDDGVRLWVDNRQIIDKWERGGFNEENSGSIELEGGKWHPIQIDHFEWDAAAAVELQWQPPNQSKQNIPATSLIPLTNNDDSGYGLEGTYYNDTDLASDKIAFSQVDTAINFDWGEGSPNNELIDGETFSARWTGSIIIPETGWYEFSTEADDGVRLWVDGNNVIDRWSDGSQGDRSDVKLFNQGDVVSVKLEYFENQGGAKAKLTWQAWEDSNKTKPTISKTFIPTHSLLPYSPSDRRNIDLNLNQKGTIQEGGKGTFEISTSASLPKGGVNIFYEITSNSNISFEDNHQGHLFLTNDNQPVAIDVENIGNDQLINTELTLKILSAPQYEETPSVTASLDDEPRLSISVSEENGEERFKLEGEEARIKEIFTIDFDRPSPENFDLNLEITGDAKRGSFANTQAGSDYKLFYTPLNEEGKEIKSRQKVSDPKVEQNTYTLNEVPQNTKSIQLQIEDINDELFEDTEKITVTLQDSDQTTDNETKVYQVIDNSKTATADLKDNEPLISLGKVVNPTEGFGFGSTIEGLGAAVTFDGNQSLSVPSHPNLNLSETGKFTQEAWIFTNFSDNSKEYGLLGSAEANQNPYPSISIDDGKIKIGFGDSSQSTQEKVIDFGHWNHIATTFDGPDYKVYVNAVEVFSTKEFADVSLPSTDNFQIGNVADAAHKFKGAIDEVRVWNSDRSAAEIQRAMVSQLEGTEEGLVGYWNFDKNQTTVGLSDQQYINNPAPQIGYVDVTLDKPFQGAQGLWVKYDIDEETSTAQANDYFNSRYRKVSTQADSERNGIIIPQGETSGRIYFTALSDVFVGPEETIAIELEYHNFDDEAGSGKNNSNYGIGENKTATITILDNPAYENGVILLNKKGQLINEINPIVIRDQEAELQVKLSSIPDEEVILELSTNQGSLGSTSYTFNASNWDDPQTVKLSGVDDSGEITVSKENNSYLSQDLTFNFTTNPDLRVTEGSKTDAVPVTPTVKIDSQGNIREDDSLSGKFVINLSAPAPEGGLTLNYTISGNAEAGKDYQNNPGVLRITIPEGETTGTIPVIPIADKTIEPDEQVTVTLLGEENQQATLTIIDDDEAGIEVVNATELLAGNYGYSSELVTVNTSEPYPNVGDIIQLSTNGFQLDNSIKLKPYNLKQENINGGTVSIKLEEILPDGVSLPDIAPENINEQNINQLRANLQANLKESGQTDEIGLAINPNNLKLKLEDDAPIVEINLPNVSNESAIGLRLPTQPESEVTVTLTANNNEGKISPDTLTFTPDNWDQYQPVTITGKDDQEIDGNISYQIKAEVTDSQDQQYNGKSFLIPVQNSDDDEYLSQPDRSQTEDSNLPVATITQAGTVSEGSDTVEITVSLDKAPSEETQVFFETIGSATINQDYQIGQKVLIEQYEPAANNEGEATKLFDSPFDEVKDGLGTSVKPAFGDIDGDGKTDAIIGNNSGLQYYKNTGGLATPDLEKVGIEGFSASENQTHFAPALGNLDSSGITPGVELVVGNADGTLSYYTQKQADGQVNLKLSPSSNNPLSGFDVGEKATPFFVDLDEDGKLDLIVGSNGGNSATATLHYFKNTGDPTNPQFAEQPDHPITKLAVGNNSTPYVADWNNDGILDIIVGQEDGSVKIFNGNQQGNYSQTANQTLITADNNSQVSPAFADLDSDGDLDAFVGTENGLEYYQRFSAVTLDSGETEKTINLQLQEDEIAEGQEIIEVRLNANVKAKAEYQLANNPTKITFDGQDDYAEISEVNHFPSDAITFEGWFKITETSSSSIPLVSYAAPGENNEFAVDFVNKQLKVGINDPETGNELTIDNVSLPEDQQWHHWAVSWESATGDFKVYQNGQEAYSGTFAQGETMNSGGTLVFGQKQDATGGELNSDRTFTGSIRDIRLWKQVRTAAEIQKNQNGLQDEQATLDPNLLAYYQGNTNSQGELSDRSLYNNNGKLVNGATSGNDISTQITLADNDQAGVTITPKSENVTLSEKDSQNSDRAAYEVKLNTEPIAPVSVYVGSQDETEVLLSTQDDLSSLEAVVQLEFTPENWKQKQTFYVQGVDDKIADGDVSAQMITTAISEDRQYDRVDIADISLTNTDDDQAQIIFKGAGEAVEGRENVYSIRLASEPAGEVRIIGTPSNDQIRLNNEFVGEPYTLTFTPENWDLEQTVRATALDDSVVEYLHTSTIDLEIKTGKSVNFESKADNSRPENALELGIIRGGYEWTNLAIADDSDLDWFKFSLPEIGNSLDFAKIDFPHDQGDLKLELYQASNLDNAILTRDNSNSNQNSETISLDQQPIGEYYLKVTGAANKYDLLVADEDYQYTQQEQDPLSVIIEDNDLPTVEIIAGPTSSEVFGEPSYFNFQLNTPARTEGNGIEVNYQLVGGSATLQTDSNDNGQIDNQELGDYRMQTEGSVRIAPGDIQNNLVVVPIDDKLLEDLNLTVAGKTAQGNGELDLNLKAPSPRQEVLKLDAQNKNYVEVANQDSLNITGDLTIEARIYLNEENFGGNRRILQKGGDFDDNGEQRSNQYRLLTEFNQFKFDLGGVGVVKAPIIELPGRAWHHVAGVYDASEGELAIYVNGEKVASKEASGTISTTNDPLYIGTKQPSAPEGDFWQGQLDEVRIWNVARPPEKIRANQANLLTGNEEGLAAYYPVLSSPSSDNALTDLSGNSSDGQLRNGASHQTIQNAAASQTIVLPESTAIEFSDGIVGKVTQEANLNETSGFYEGTVTVELNDPTGEITTGSQGRVTEETVTVELLPGNGYKLPENPQATLRIQDDDVAGVRIVQVGDNTVVREGETATFQVALLSEPTADVTLTLTPGGEIKFPDATGSNLGEVKKNVYSFNESSDQLDVSLNSLVTTEQAKTVAFEIKLDTKPNSDVIVELYDGNETDQNPEATVNFTLFKENPVLGQQPGNWNQPQQVIIGNLDADSHGNLGLTAKIYQQKADGTTGDLIQDNIQLGINSETKTINPKTTEITISPENWFELQTVTIEGADDSVAEPGLYHQSQISYEVISADSGYNGLTVPDQRIDVSDRVFNAETTATTMQEGFTNLQNSIDAIEIPLIGTLAGKAPSLISDITDELVPAVGGEDNLTANRLKGIIENSLSSLNLDFLDVTVEMSEDAIDVVLDVSKNYELFSLPLDQDLGLDALGIGLKTEGDLQSNFNFDVGLGFGISEDYGFYLDTETTKVEAAIKLNLDDFQGQGNLGFLRLDMEDDADNPTELAVNFKAGLKDLDNYKTVKFFDVDGDHQLDADQAFTYPIKNPNQTPNPENREVKEPFTSVSSTGEAEAFPTVGEASEEAKRVNTGVELGKNTFDEAKTIQNEGIYRTQKDDQGNVEKYYFDFDRDGELDASSQEGLFSVEPNIRKWVGNNGKVKPFRIEQKKVDGELKYYFDQDGDGQVDVNNNEVLTRQDKAKLDKNSNNKLDADQEIAGEGTFVQGTGIAFQDSNNNGTLDVGENYVNSGWGTLTLPESAIVSTSSNNEKVSFLDLDDDGAVDQDEPTVKEDTDDNENTSQYLDLNGNDSKDSGELEANDEKEWTVSEDAIVTYTINDSSENIFLDKNDNDSQNTQDQQLSDDDIETLGLTKSNREIIETEVTFVDVDGNEDLDVGSDPVVRIEEGVRFVDIDGNGKLTRDNEGNKLEPYATENNEFDTDSLTGNGTVIELLNDGSRLTLTELQNWQNSELGFSDLFAYEFSGLANLGLKTETSIAGAPAFPSINFDLAVGLPLFNYGNQEEAGEEGLSVEFNDIKLDFGTFLTDFVTPIVTTVDEIISPVKPVLDILNADTKIFSAIGLENEFNQDSKPGVSILDLSSTIASQIPEDTTDKNLKRIKDSVEKATQFIETVDQIIETVESLKALTESDGENVILELGSYNLDDFKGASDDPADTASKVKPNQDNLSQPQGNKTASQQAQEKASPKQKKAYDNLVGESKLDGFDIPMLTNPVTPIRILLGEENVDLITYDIPDLEFFFGKEQEFLLWSPPIMEGSLELGFEAKTDLSVGYDTGGLGAWQETGFELSQVQKVLDGFYVNDLDENGEDKDELSVTATIAAGLSASIVIAKASLKGGLEGYLGFDLVDEGELQGKSDGKVRGSEIISRLDTPLELFDLKGKLEALVNGSIEVGLDAGFFDIMTEVWSAELRTTLAEFNVGASGLTFSSDLSNSYIYGATVFFDANFNHQWDEGEPVTFTNEYGQYNLEIALEWDANEDGEIKALDGQIVSVGGADTSSGNDAGQFVGLPGASIVTPLTSLQVPLVVKNGLTPEEADTLIKAQLGLTLDSALADFDALQVVGEEQAVGLEMYLAHIQVQAIFNHGKAFLDGLQGSDSNHWQAVQEAFAAFLKNRAENVSEPYDVSNESDIQQFLNALAAGSEKSPIEKQLQTVAQITAQGNQFLDEVAEVGGSKSLTDALPALASVKRVLQGEKVTDLIKEVLALDPNQSNNEDKINNQFQVFKAILNQNYTFVDGDINAFGNRSVGVAVNLDSISESQSDETVEFVIELSQPAPNQGVTVAYSISGTATLGEDYNIAEGNKTTGEVYIEPRQETASIALNLLDDNIPETTENITVNLQTVGEGYQIAPNGQVALLEVQDDDTAEGETVEESEGEVTKGDRDNNDLEGTAAADTLIGGYGNDTLKGKQGNDFLRGGHGQDELFGGEGDDRLEGNFGNDILQGGAGNDLLQGSSGEDQLSGGTGNDSIAGGSEKDILEGNAGNDKLEGGANDDILQGGADNDWLVGNRGNDRLVGGQGDDQLNGGAGADIFVFNSPDEGFDTILDFNPEEGDKIQVSPEGFGLNNPDNISDNFRFISGVLDFNGQNLALIENDEATYSYFSDLSKIIELKGKTEVNTPVPPSPPASLAEAVTEETFDGDELIAIEEELEFEEDASVAPPQVGTSGRDELIGGSGDDILFGMAGNDILKGKDGWDDLEGDAGDDFLWGGKGEDFLTGGTGADIFFFDSPEEGGFGSGDLLDEPLFADDPLFSELDFGSVIFDFYPSEGDKIQVSAEGFGTNNLDDFSISTSEEGLFTYLEFQGERVTEIFNAFEIDLSDLSNFVEIVETTNSQASVEDVANPEITILDDIIERGHLEIAVPSSLPAFDLEMASLLAAALFGDADQVETQETGFSEGLELTANGEVDLTPRRLTHTIARDAELGLDFSPIYLFDHQDILVPKDSGIENSLDLDGRTIGVVEGGTALENLQNEFSSENVQFEAKFYSGLDELVEAYDRGEIEAYSTDRSLILDRLDDLSHPDNHNLLNVELSQAPIAMALPENDSQWADVVRWVSYVPMAAEALGISSQNIDELIAENTDDKTQNDSSPEIRRFLGLENELGSLLGLPNDFAVNVIKEVGNYEEIYDRHFDIERDRNLLAEDGGVFYSLPFSGTERDVNLVENSDRNVLEEVKQRGQLLAKISGQAPGFSLEQPDGTFVGFDVDLVKALAAAVLGDPEAVTFDDESSFLEGFTKAANGEVDVTASLVTHNLARDASLGVDFAPTYLYTGGGVLVREDSGISNLAMLNGRRVGFLANTTAQQNLQDALTELGGAFISVAFSDRDEMFAAYDRGEVEAITNDRAFLASGISTLANPEEHQVLDEVLSKEPLAMVVDENQSQWRDVVSAVNEALVRAEELGITQDNIDQLLVQNTDDNPENEASPAIRQFLGIESSLGEALGLPNDFAAQAVKAVGNYGEIYERHFDANVLRRGQNELSDDFGLQSSLPFGKVKASATPAPSEETDLVFGSTGDDILDAAVSNDGFDGENNLTFTGSGEDEVDASQSLSGANRIYSGSDYDELFAGTGDRLFGNNGDDLLDASQGNGDNRLYGGDGNDELLTGGNDRAFGGQGDDRLFILAEGDNLLQGGNGEDQFWITTAEIPNSPSSIADFVSGEDTIGVGGFPNLTFNDLTFTQENSTTIINLGANSELVDTDTPLAQLQGIQANSLTETDFNFVAQSPL